MTAIVKLTYQCGSCRHYFSAIEKPAECPSCHAKLSTMQDIKTRSLESPVQLSEQIIRLGLNDADMLKFIMGDHPDAGVYCLKDAACRMAVILHTPKMRSAAIKDMCVWGKKIGKLAEAIEAYVSSGGKYYNEKGAIHGVGKSTTGYVFGGGESTALTRDSDT